MSLLSPRLQLRVAQKQILTPGLVQMVTVLQLNRLELKDMITQEIVKHAVLEESVEKPSFETFLSAPVTLGDHLRSQLSVSLISDQVRTAAESIIGNLDEDGYLFAPLDEIASVGEHKPEHVEEALRIVHALDPAGVGARDLRECLLLQIESVNGRGGVAWQIVSNHLRLLETKQF